MRLQPPLPVLYITPRTDISSVRVHVLLKYKPLNAVRECGITFFSNIHCLYRTCNMQLTSYDGIFPSRQILIFVELIYCLCSLLAQSIPHQWKTVSKSYQGDQICPCTCYRSSCLLPKLQVLGSTHCTVL
jgi:hypothetical protein